MINNFFRFEFKYPISERDIKHIEEDIITCGLEKDDSFLDGKDYYTVSSLYFDTHYFRDYYDKIGGFKDRLKIRARFYEEFLTENTRGVWLELKRKNDMVISKKRIYLKRDKWDKFVDGLYSHLSINGETGGEDLAVLREICYEINGSGRRPRIFVTYHRKPYEYNWGANKFRLTFDYNIYSKNTASIPDSIFNASRVIFPKDSVMEIKYNGYLPPFMGQIIQKYNLVRDAYSKYASGVDAERRYYPLSK